MKSTACRRCLTNVSLLPLTQTTAQRKQKCTLAAFHAPDASTTLSPLTQRLDPGTADGLSICYLWGNQGLAGNCPKTSNAANKQQSQGSTEDPPDPWVQRGRMQREHSTAPGGGHPSSGPGTTPCTSKHKARGLRQVAVPRASSASSHAGHPEGSVMHLARASLAPEGSLSRLTKFPTLSRTSVRLIDREVSK